ncbi:hypothetical protein A4S06_09620 [Erysipelotrichaceae bacterium MTC7]|nr:hypothetical protein A4S06_09620 [Erysipelotrichaceae bacterium MTC7]
MRSKQGFLLSESIVFLQVCVVLVLFLSISSQSLYRYQRLDINRYDEVIEIYDIYEQFHFEEIIVEEELPEQIEVEAESIIDHEG